jgi:pSer/pThr/pTyr-binding forkhead associated (FHA) protein
MAKLILSLDDVVLQEIPLTKERTTIGRKPHNDIQIDNLAVSGEHAVIETIMNDCILEDLGSTNGTLVNGVLAKRHVLRNNDVIELGKYKLRFVGVATAATMHAPAPADYEKTMVWRPGGVKPPAGAPSTPGPAAGASASAAGGPPHAPPHVASPIHVPRQSPATPTPAPGVAYAPTAASAGAAPAAASASAAPAAASAPIGGAGGNGVARILSGPRTGRDLKLVKPLTTLGKPGTQVAVVTRRPQGYFIAHVEGPPTLVNGRAIGTSPHALKHGDTFEVADVKMEFLLRDEPAGAESGGVWKVLLALVAVAIVAYLVWRLGS